MVSKIKERVRERERHQKIQTVTILEEIMLMSIHKMGDREGGVGKKGKK